jgi:hypothetical protein
VISIPITRYNLTRYHKQDKARCQDAYVRVKAQQTRLEKQGKNVKVDTGALGLAANHFRTGIILRKYNLFGIAAEQFERAAEILALI